MKLTDISWQDEFKLTGLMAKELNRQEGYGRTGKYLSKAQQNYFDKLERYLRDSGLEKRLASEIANTLVRLRKGSLKRLLNEGYLTDPERLVKKIKAELKHYQENGFTQKQTKVLIARLFSWQRIQRLLDSGLNKRDATQIVTKQTNPEEWWKERKPIRDELKTDGLGRHDATRIVMMHTNPKRWWEKVKPIRDRLMAGGLGRCDATQIIISWSSPEQRWEKRAKPKRSKLMADDLTKYDSTQVIIRQSNPEKWWGKAKLVRDELMTHGLSKYNATRIVIAYADPREWWKKTKPLIQNLQRKPFQLGFSEAIRLIMRYKQSKIEEFLNLKRVKGK